ncbi:MAG: site-specific DNA-methyltransferase [Anaerolineales bacterium]|nr:site-specific DNA-methyltransferase [Anaerolineales bacterium]
MSDLPLNQVLLGDAVQIMDSLPAGSVDLIFADPPYNLQIDGQLYRPNLSPVDGVDTDWDKFDSFREYDAFTCDWLQASKRVLKEDGAIWVIGTYHNIFRVGRIMQDLGFWFLNDIIWIKVNPMPNFHGVRFTNAHETLIWATKKREARYTFNYNAMKEQNDGKQMRSDWLLNICKGGERVRDEDGNKVHPAQKPEALLERVILSSTKPGDIILDPFFGSGTTGVAAKRLQRNWIGIERNETYISFAEKRLTKAEIEKDLPKIHEPNRRRKRVSLKKLIRAGLLQPGQELYYRGKREIVLPVREDGKLKYDGVTGSFHQISKLIREGRVCNGWNDWYIRRETGDLQKLNVLRQKYWEMELE